MKFLKQTNYIGYVIAKLSKHIKISMKTSSDFFFTDDSLKQENDLELFYMP